MTLIDKCKNWLFWWQVNRIKSRNAQHKFNKRSRAAKLGWQRRRENDVQTNA